ncbi:MAG: AraC family transcriptional regulator [Victivallaceae bacterium]|nr:AraC family transcriptional regulator [Victivallaceae bacterium]
MFNNHSQLWTDKFYESIDPQINSLGFFSTAPGWVSPPFNRVQKDFDVWYITQGAGYVKINNEWIHFRKGDLLTIKPGEDYQQEKNDDNSQFSTYALHLDIFKDNNEDIEKSFICEWPRKLSLYYQTDLDNLFDKLLQVYTFKKAGCSILIKSILFNIIDILFDSVRGNLVQEKSPGFNAIVKTSKYIEIHFNENLTLEDMARHSGFSYTYFSRLFNQYLKSSPVDFLINYRLKMAKIFLSKGYSVSETSLRCGFHSIHYFSRLFKKKFKLSPSEFTTSCRIAHF